MGSPRIGVKGKAFLEMSQKEREKDVLRAELSMEGETQGQVRETELGCVSKHLIFYSIHTQFGPSVPSPNLSDTGAPEVTPKTGRTRRPPCSVGQEGVSQADWRL